MKQLYPSIFFIVISLSGCSMLSLSSTQRQQVTQPASVEKPKQYSVLCRCHHGEYVEYNLGKPWVNPECPDHKERCS